MKRLTFEGNFCDIAMCRETPGGSFCESGMCSQRKVWERLKYYEDMEEQGRLNITPCKVGDKVYEVDGEHGIVEHTISEIVWVINSIAVDDAGNEWADYWEANEFEAAPKTREEAEQAVKAAVQTFNETPSGDCEQGGAKT